MIEITGTQEKIDGLVEVLRPFGILEMVRTGAIAMTRGAEEHDLPALINDEAAA
jgi:acetolactate synthase-1/3 small subunit